MINKFILISLSLMTLLLPKFSIASTYTQYNGLYEHPFNSFYDLKAIPNNGTYNRQDNDYFSGYARAVFSKDLDYLPVEGESWTFSLKDTSTNRSLGTIIYTYSNSCLFYDIGFGKVQFYCFPDSTSTYTVHFLGTFSSRCISVNPYKYSFSHNGAATQDTNFNPSEFQPGKAVINPVRTVSPYLPAKNGGKAAEVQEGTAVIRLVVKDNLGCKVPVQNTEVELENTIVPDSGSHKHFSAENEYGTGQYVESLPAWNAINTTKTKITTKTDQFGVVNASYKAGLYGVDEKITATTNGMYKNGLSKEFKAESNLRVGVRNLIPLDLSGATYTVRGGYTDACGDKHHNDGNYARRSHYVTNNTLKNIEQLNDLYIARTGAPDLCLNDASLKYGGYFDNGSDVRAFKGANNELAKCHFSHRRGIDIDINVRQCIDNLNERVMVNGESIKKREVLDEIAEKTLKAFKVKEESQHYRFF
jgi:hypothetical protein